MESKPLWHGIVQWKGGWCDLGILNATTFSIAMKELRWRFHAQKSEGALETMPPTGVALSFELRRQDLWLKSPFTNDIQENAQKLMSQGAGFNNQNASKARRAPKAWRRKHAGSPNRWKLMKKSSTPDSDI
jgi:hypothetical protein